MSIQKSELHSQEHTSPVNYIVGFVLSIVLTLLAYFAVVNEWFSTRGIIFFIVTLALVQFAVQLFFFLHLGQEGRPRWRLATLGFMVVIVAILVFGSLWIMDNLNYNMQHMSPTDQKIYLHENEGI